MLYLERTCPDEVDDAGIRWPTMLAGYIAVRRCPRGMKGQQHVGSWSCPIAGAHS